MPKRIQKIKKLVFLNQVTLDSLAETNKLKVIKNFTEAGIKILDADFGFAWWKFYDSDDYKLVYKSSGTPYEPPTPRGNAGNYIARSTQRPFFDSDVKAKNYKFDIVRYLKSYIIIPIQYNNLTYGSIVLCYKNKHNFSKDEIDLATVLGTTTAQTVTIFRLLDNTKKSKLSLEKQEAKFRALVENNQELILHVDLSGKILYANPAIKKITGILPHEIIGKNISDFANKNRINGFHLLTKKILANPKESYVAQFTYANKNKNPLFLESTSSLMPEDSGLSGIIINIRDITKSKKLSEMKVVKKLFQQEKMKIESIAEATHELRTPVAIIKGNVDLAFRASNGKLGQAQNYFKAIDKEVSHLSNILSDLSLVTSKKSITKQELIIKDVDLRDILKSVVKRCKPLADKKRISIKILNMPQVIIPGDKTHLCKMFMNIVKNSIIYGNKNGKTTIDLELKPKFVLVNIRDTGIGIDKTDLPYIFDRFYRADKSHHSTNKSTGLGLAIVKWVAESHGGNVSVKSSLEGSTFTVLLPLKKSNK